MLKRWFVRGVVLITPILVTVSVIIWIFKFIDNLSHKFVTSHLDNYLYTYLGLKIPGLGIIVSFLIIVLVGGVASLAGFRVFKWIEGVFLRFPFVKKIYGPVRKVINLIFSQHPVFRKVVLVEYPRKGVYSIGFLTSSTSKRIIQADKAYYNVFIPSSPSPLTGFTLFVPEEDVIFLDMSVEEATKVIISGGMLNPEDENGIIL